MARPVRYHEQFRKDLADRVHWLRRHRPPQQRTDLARSLTSFRQRVAAFPGVGHEVQRVGTVSYRVGAIGGPLPYLIWYSYDTADDVGAVSLLMLMHESQDRERFEPERFD